jgi:hypothetical protein
MSEIIEVYGKIGGGEKETGGAGEDDRRFDVEFWQRQGPAAIFEAALDMVKDYQIVRQGYADQPRLQRTIEHFQRL